MKLDYATLISPYPFPLEKVGAIKAPTLREIWNPHVTWRTYHLFLQLLLMTPQIYCGRTDISMFDALRHFRCGDIFTAAGRPYDGKIRSFHQGYHKHGNVL